MKKYLITLIFIVFAFSCVAETIYLGENLRKTRNERGENTLNTPFAKIDVADDSTAVTFTFSIPSVEVDMDSVLYPNSYWWRAHGFYPSMEPGSPALPQRSAIVRMPLTAKNIKLTVNHANWQNVEGYVPTPARPVLEEDDVKYSVLNVPMISDYTDADQPVASISNIGKETDTQMVYVHIAPFRYPGFNAPVQACYDFSFTVSYEANDSDELKKNVDSGSESSGSRRTVTPIGRPGYPFEPVDSVHMMRGDSLIKYNGGIYNLNSIKNNYLVITTPKYERYFPSFVKWKNKLGHEVKILSKSQWDRDELIDTIHRVYSSGFNLTYVLFAGTINEIPATNCGRYYSDLYYACMDGIEDRNPDLFTGRLLVNNAEEMPVILNKLMRYHTMGLDIPGFHSRAAHIGFYQVDENKPDVELYPFISVSENVRNHAMKNGIKVKRIYAKQIGSTPTYWDSWCESRHNKLMPDDLREPNFAWNSDTRDVLDAFREGALYILYNGHGDETSWDMPGLQSGSFSFLGNGNRLPIVFSIACNTGAFDNPLGFAQNLLTSSNGAVSVVASEGVCQGAYAQAMTLGIFNHIWLDAEYSSSMIDLSQSIVVPIDISLQQIANKNDIDDLVLGRVLREGCHYMNYLAKDSWWTSEVSRPDEIVKDRIESTMARFHVFGDPGMTMYVGTPNVVSLPKLSISKISDSKYKAHVSVSLPSVIGVYNETQNKVYRNFVNSRTITFDEYDKLYISIQQYNSVPFFFEINKGVVTASGAYVSEDQKMAQPLLRSVKQTAYNAVEVEYDLSCSDDFIKQTNATLSLLTANNVVLANTVLSEDRGTVPLYVSALSPGMYIVRIQTDNGVSTYKKVLIKL